ncbi:MAG: MBOAT family O-acyltransferase [Patescibacteria group bacterium]
MLFNSLQFLIFFPLTTLVYFLIPHPFRWGWLLLASAYFYMSFVPVYILILVATIVIDFFCGILIENAKGRSRKFFLLVSILANIGILFFFKYFNFFNENLLALTNFLHIAYDPLILKIALPIGLSFHVFQSISYTIEVYRGRQKAEHNIGILALYVLFYPQLVAGPIERPQHLIHQFYERHKFEIRRILSGLTLILGGFLKKVVIADRLAQFVNPVFSNTTDYYGVSFMIAIIFFTFQIYCDFSGYCDIAVGSALVLGIKIMQNFDRPFFARTVAKFWQRWHISLSSWLRDYLYYPIVFFFKKKNSFKLYLSSLITFTLIGLWHGANWTFIIFGTLQAVYLIVGQTTKAFRTQIVEWLGIVKWPKCYHVWQSIMVFGLFSLSLVFFRADTLSDVFYIFSHIGDGWSLFFSQITDIQFLNQYVFIGYTRSEFFLAVFSVFILILFEFLERKEWVRAFITRRPVFFGSFTFAFGVLTLLVFGKFSGQEFIYFQF